MEINQKDIDELKELRDAVTKKIEEMEKPKPVGRWMPVNGGVYFYATGVGRTHRDSWFYSHEDWEKFYMGNVFKAEQEAKDEVRRRKIEVRLKDLALKSWGGEEIDWSDSSQKWEVSYLHETDEFRPEFSVTCQTATAIAFRTRESSLSAIKEIGEDDLKFYMGIE